MSHTPSEILLPKDNAPVNTSRVAMGKNLSSGSDADREIPTRGRTDNVGNRVNRGSVITYLYIFIIYQLGSHKFNIYFTIYSNSTMLKIIFP